MCFFFTKLGIYCLKSTQIFFIRGYIRKEERNCKYVWKRTNNKYFNLLDVTSDVHDIVLALSELDFDISRLVLLFSTIWASLNLIFVLFPGFMLSAILWGRANSRCLEAMSGYTFQFSFNPVVQARGTRMLSSVEIGVFIRMRRTMMHWPPGIGVPSLSAPRVCWLRFVRVWLFLTWIPPLTLLP